jgi:hypothetical protein
LLKSSTSHRKEIQRLLGEKQRKGAYEIYMEERESGFLHHIDVDGVDRSRDIPVGSDGWFRLCCELR